MENILALIFIIVVSNVIWFLVYKNEINKQINIYKEYNASLEKHKEYLQESEKKVIEFSKSLNETVKLVTENMKFKYN